MSGPVFSQIVSLRQRRDQLAELAATPAEFEAITKADLEELRHLARPPELVKECLELVYIILHAPNLRKGVQRLSPGSRLEVSWHMVRAMLARFEAFFPSMRTYDIAPLIAAPEIVEYIAREYLNGERLMEERVRRSNRASAALFGWCGSAAVRVRAALELAAVNAQLAELEQQQQQQAAPPPEAEAEQQPQAAPSSEPESAPPQVEQEQQRQAVQILRWKCRAISGWVDYPDDVDAELRQAAPGGRVRFGLRGEQYEVDLPSRTQRNLSTGYRRAVRPPCSVLNVDSLQGTWQASWGPLILVRGAEVHVYGQAVQEPLEDVGAGLIRWEYAGGWETKAGSTPMCVLWNSLNPEDPVEVMWTATAASG